MKIPSELKAPGRALWRRLARDYGFAGVEEIVRQLCQTEDRVFEVREAITAMGGPSVPGTDKLLNLEVKLANQWRQSWRIAGFSDRTPAPRREDDDNA